MDKTLVQQHDEALAKIATLEQCVQDAGKATADALKALEAMTGERDAAVQAGKDAAVTAEAALSAAVGQAEAERQAHDATKAELAKAKAALANPAFADAARVGQGTATSEGGEPPAAPPLTEADIIRQHNQIADPRERALFRLEHKEVFGL